LAEYCNLEINMASLLDKLKTYAASDICPMHMPGHKREASFSGGLPYELDISEIAGFDNLYHREGVLAELAASCARLWGSSQAWPLVNGATGGLLAAIRAATQPGGNVIMARNCHCAVYHALELNRLRPIYLLPPPDASFGICGSITAAQVEAALAAHPETALVIITSPTYEGMISPTQEIAAAAHRHGVPLLVDAAHGAHHGFAAAFPASAVTDGADLTVMSLHKTLPALTQSALLHLSGGLVDAAAVERELAIFQTSSPSYLLLASIDQCVRLLSDRSAELFATYTDRLANLDASLRQLSRLIVLGQGKDSLANHPAICALAPGRLVISGRAAGLSGTALATVLREQHRIEPEMAYRDYVIAITTICDKQANFDRLAGALATIDRGLPEAAPQNIVAPAELPGLPELALTSAEALAQARQGRAVALAKGAGLTSLEYIWAYPPGVPLLVPGEIISRELIDYCHSLQQSGLRLMSDSSGLPQSIRVLTN
jgi:arginine decarboxylase